MIDQKSLALVPSSLVEAESMASTLSKSGMLPDHFKGKPADVFWAISFGLEVGFGPVAALNSVYVVHGRPGLYADAMVALVLSSGHCKYFRKVSSDDRQATYETMRNGDPEPTQVSVTIEAAERAGWSKNNTKYATEPRRMLEARAKSWLAKDRYPDVLRGIGSVEELRDEGETPTKWGPAPIIDIAPAAKPAPDPAKALLERMLNCTMISQLEALLPDLAKVPKHSPALKELREQYSRLKARLSDATGEGPPPVAA